MMLKPAEHPQRLQSTSPAASLPREDRGWDPREDRGWDPPLPSDPLCSRGAQRGAEILGCESGQPQRREAGCAFPLEQLAGGTAQASGRESNHPERP